MRHLALLAVVAAALPALARADGAETGGALPSPEATVEGTLTLVTGSGPRVRLEQIGNGLRPPYTWDFGGDDREFFLVDLTGFSIPARFATGIPPGHSLGIHERTGYVSMGGDFEAVVPLMLWSTAPVGTRLLVEETNAVVAGRNLMRFKNNGPSNVAFTSGSEPVPIWAAGSASNGSLAIATATAPALALSPAGNLTLAGVLTQLSDRGAKQDVEALDSEALLARLGSLPLATWSYSGETARHVGPMAQDFGAAFGLGADDRHVAPSDLAGVELVAAQALDTRLQGLDARAARARAGLAPAEARWQELQDRLTALEACARRNDP